MVKKPIPKEPIKKTGPLKDLPNSALSKAYERHHEELIKEEPSVESFDFLVPALIILAIVVVVAYVIFTKFTVGN